MPLRQRWLHTIIHQHQHHSHNNSLNYNHSNSGGNNITNSRHTQQQ